MTPLAVLTERIVACRACPRLVAWREQVAREKRAAYRDQEYWGRPVPGFGDPAARLLVVGLAPGAHGGNRTGRVFTGDRSGEWLFGSLHRAGFASQATATHRGDGLTLADAYIAACVRCVPPDNKPAVDERDRCLPYLGEEFALLPGVRVAVCLGAFAWDGFNRVLKARGGGHRAAFGHRAEVADGELTVLGCYHPSQQNTSTRRLTAPMLDAVWARAREILGGPDAPA